MAVPLLVVSVIVVGTLLGVLMLTTNVAAVPSNTISLLTFIIGKLSMSVIVPMATIGAVAVVLGLVTVPVNVNVSVPSLMPSVNVATGTVTVVAPAGIVIVVVTLV